MTSTCSWLLMSTASPVRLRGLNPSKRHGQVVASDRHVREDVDALRIGRSGNLAMDGCVRQRDGHPWNEGATRVPDRAGNAASSLAWNASSDGEEHTNRQGSKHRCCAAFRQDSVPPASDADRIRV